MNEFLVWLLCTARNKSLGEIVLTVSETSVRGCLLVPEWSRNSSSKIRVHMSSCANPSGHTCLAARWYCGFESHQGHGCLSLCECCVLSSRSLWWVNHTYRGILLNVVSFECDPGPLGAGAPWVKEESITCICQPDLIVVPQILQAGNIFVSSLTNETSVHCMEAQVVLWLVM
jgi:hypothetical protein